MPFEVPASVGPKSTSNKDSPYGQFSMGLRPGVASLSGPRLSAPHPGLGRFKPGDPRRTSRRGHFMAPASCRAGGLTRVLGPVQGVD